MRRAPGASTDRLRCESSRCARGIPGMTAVAAAREARTLPSPVNAAARPRIVVILPRGEAIRNFVHTGALDSLSARAQLTVLTVLPNDEYRQSFERRFGRVLELTSDRERWLVRIQ